MNSGALPANAAQNPGLGQAGNQRLDDCCRKRWPTDAIQRAGRSERAWATGDWTVPLWRRDRPASKRQKVRFEGATDNFDVKFSERVVQLPDTQNFIRAMVEGLTLD
jgi:hypothetical protein